MAAIVDSSNDAIISKNLDGVISTWNPAAHQLLGYSEAEAVGQPITIIIPPDLHNEEKEILRRLRIGERIEHYETRRATRDGRTLDVSITISPVRDATGAIVGASKILRDVTESKRNRAALRASERRLANEIAGARTLQSISTRLISERTEESLLARLIDAAMELMEAHASSIQMLAPDGKSLTLLASRGFHEDSAAFWQRVTADAGSTCGAALRDNVRVMVSDVGSCEFMAGTQDLEEYRRSGIRAVQSTPLQSRKGYPLGVISTHWRMPHVPTEDAFTLFDVLARQAADLIERTRAEDALRDSQERIRLIANTAPVIIWMSNIEKGCSFVNQTWLDLTGQPVDAVLDSGWMDRIHPEDSAESWDIYSQAFDRRERFQIDFRLRAHDGEYRWIVSTGAPRYQVDGSFAGYIGSAMDVTERRLSEQAMASLKHRLVDVQEEERARIARELHDDVVQRLSVVSFTLHALKSSHAPATESRRELDEACEDISNLAKDVQALSHRLHPARLDLMGIAPAARALCRETSKQRDVDITFEAENIPASLSKRIALCLYRVLQEALQNAVKHSGAGRIDVRLCAGAGQIELTVRDSGSGFDVELAKGRGLGLISIKERLKPVHGRLAIRSQLQHGTTIYASVPLAQDEADAPAPSKPGPSSHRPRVLLADDDEPLRTALSRLLSVSCDVVGVAPDSGTLFNTTKELRPQVVLLDFSLPGGLTGLEVCRRLKKMAPEVRVVVFTGSDDPDLKQMAHEAGASAFVWKLQGPDDLLLAIQRAIDSQ